MKKKNNKSICSICQRNNVKLKDHHIHFIYAKMRSEKFVKEILRKNSSNSFAKNTWRIAKKLGTPRIIGLSLENGKKCKNFRKKRILLIL